MSEMKLKFIFIALTTFPPYLQLEIERIKLFDNKISRKMKVMTTKKIVSIFKKLHLIRFLIVTILVVNYVSSDAVETAAETNVFLCMTNYLRNEKLVDRRFGLKSLKGFNDTNCESYLEEFRFGFYTEIFNKLKNDEDLVENADCLLAQLKKLFLAEASMKRIIYENSKKMSRRKRKKALRVINYSIEKKMETAVMLCTTEEVFGELFDVLYSSANDSDESDDKSGEDYCHRKYMVDKNFINTTVYNVTLNPEHIDTSKLNCDETVQSSIEESEDELKREFLNSLDHTSKRKGKCIGKTIRTHEFFENSLVVVMFGEIGIPSDEKAVERSLFIKKMKDLYEAIMNC